MRSELKDWPGVPEASTPNSVEDDDICCRRTVLASDNINIVGTILRWFMECIADAISDVLSSQC
jgi:hypothetical protein